MNNKKIVVTGATGLIGKVLCQQLADHGYELTIVCRDISSAQKAIAQTAVFILLSDSTELEKAVDGAFGVINLSGAPIIGKRWTVEYKKILHDSRIAMTKSVVTAIEKAVVKPTVLINGSAVGYYGMIPSSTPYSEIDNPGSDFLAQLCDSWEKEAFLAEKYGTRVVCIRSAVVLDKTEGALPRMLSPFYYYVGGPIGAGKQWFSWIHIKDEVGIICFALENKAVIGAINAVAPDPVTNKTLATTIGTIVNKPSLIPVPPVFLKMIFGESAEVLTTGVNVSPQKILDLGYTFHFPMLKQALLNILK